MHPPTPVTVLCAAALLCACGGQPPSTGAEAAVATMKHIDIAPPDGNVRLGGDPRPVRYSVALRIDPRATTFEGTVGIEVELTEPRAVIRLHAQDMKITAATAGERAIRDIVAGENGGLALVFDPPLAAGAHTLTLAFEGALGEVPESLYRVQDGDRWYAFTQFQPLDARAAFPCFDQPGFKTPFAVTLTVPQGMLALSSAPETGRTEAAEWTTFTFAETRPLPTYLLAFAVGAFEVRAAPADATPGVPFRVIATAGKARLADYALTRTPLLLAWLTDYFGRPHPFAKLDQIGVPNFAAGAMENVGLVTYRESLLLVDEATAPPQQRAWTQGVIAHELAHMWYGNLVTPEWWDDLWLNEAFATWMATKTVAAVDPELEVELDAVARTQRVMGYDAQTHTRAIRQPIRHGGDVENAFDPITYGKGAAVLTMVEAWLGAETFRDGVRRYMDAHAYGVARTSDLLSALSEASGQDVEGTIGAFLDQPGTPLVEIRTTCHGEAAPATLALTQTRYRPAGSEAPVGEPWRIPVCVRYAIGETTHRSCFVFDDPAAEQTLPEPGCPSWLHPNAGERGYYRWRIADDAMRALVGPHRGALALTERAALPGHLRALLEADVIDAGAVLDALDGLRNDEHRVVVRGVLGLLRTFDRVAVEPAHRATWRRIAGAWLAPHLARIGPTRKDGEPFGHTLLRSSLRATAFQVAEDPSVRDSAKETLQSFLADPASVTDARIGTDLPIAVRDAGEPAWKALVEQVPRAPTPAARVALIRTLAHFDDPTLARRSLDLFLNGPLLAQDYRTLMSGYGRSDAAVRLAWDWMTTHYEQLVERLGARSARYLPWMGAGFCDVAARAEVAAFFAEPARRPEGTERNLGMALESIDRCVRMRARARPATSRWLQARDEKGRTATR